MTTGPIGTPAGEYAVVVDDLRIDVSATGVDVVDEVSFRIRPGEDGCGDPSYMAFFLAGGNRVALAPLLPRTQEQRLHARRLYFVGGESDGHALAAPPEGEEVSVVG